MKSRRRSLRLSQVNQQRIATLGTVALAAGALISPAAAATQTLNVSGNWDTVTTNWDAGSVWTNGNDASFGGTASAIELAGDIQVAGITSANALTFNNNTPGGSITFVEAAAVTPFIGGGQNLTFNLAIGGTQGLNIDNAGGQVTLNAENALSGAVTVTAGTLALGANGALNGIGSLDIAAAGTFTSSGVNQIGTVTVTNAGTLNLGGNDTVAAYVSNAGTLNGPGILRASTYNLNDATVVNGELGNGVITTNGTVAINGNTGTNGALNVQSGTTTVDANIGATTLAVSSGAALTTTATGNLADTAALTLSGTGALNLGHNETIGNLVGAGAVNLGANTLTLSNGAGATTTAIIDGSGGLSLQAGTQTLAGSSTYTGATNVNGGTLALTGTLAGTTVNVASGAALTSTGGLADGTNLNVTGTGAVSLTGAETVASLIAGTGAIDATGVDLTVTGNLTSAGNVNVKNLTVGNLNGSSTITSTGTVTASAGGFSGNIASGALVKDTAGTLTLSTAQSFTGGTNVNDGTLVLGHAFNTLADGGALTVASSGTVDIQANTDTVATFTSNGGTLSGTGTLTAATYALNDGTAIDANLGAGSLTTNGAVAINGDAAAANFTVQSGVTTLDGNASAGTVNVTGGTLDIATNGSLSAVDALNLSPGATLSTSADEQINDTAAVTNNGTLAIGGNETVGSLNNSGTISGAGTLTTDVYNLGTGSNITGNLGAGTVKVTGNTDISGTSAADVVGVTGGTLVLDGDNLADTAVVTNSAAISLTGDDTVLTLNNTGTIAGAGTLTATEYNLDTGSNITGNLGTGTVNIIGATSISGTSAATTVDIATGQTLTLSGNNLADTTDVIINSASTLNMQGNDTVGTLVNNAGTLGGFGTLTASSYTLNDGTTLDASLGNGDIFTNGTVAINGLTGIGAFTVQTGTTILNNTSGANIVTVADDSSLILTASGELNVTTAINIGVDASLTTGGVNQLGNSTLTNAGTFTLGGNDTVGAYVSNGGTYNGGFTLTALTYALNDGTVIDSNLGTGELTANGTVAINADTNAGIFNVESGETTLAGSAAATDVNVTGGALTLTADGSINSATTLDLSGGGALNLGASDQIGDTAVVTNAGSINLDANNDTVGSYTSNGGTLSGTGTLTAVTYALNDGTTTDANLGDGDITANGAVSINGTTGAGALLVESGETTLANTSGATSVNVTGGALTLTDTASLQDTATITLSGGTTLTTGGDEQLANTATVDSQGAINLGGDETIASLAGAGTVSLGENNLTLANAGGTDSAAMISGTGGLALEAGTQTLSGASTYTGATNVNGGTLALTGSLASTEVNVASGAALTSTGGLADATDLTLTDTATATLTGNETLASLNGGTGTVDATGVDLVVTGTLDTAGSILVDDLTVGTLNGTSTITSSSIVTVSDGAFDGTIATGSLVKNTAGSLTLTATQGYTGTTHVTGGTLVLGHVTNTIADASEVTIESGTTLDIQANTDTVATFTSNGGTLSGTGTLTAATYALNDGTTTDANLGNGDITTNGTVGINGTTGAGALVVQSGETTLANTSGATSVNITAGALTLTDAAALQSAATVTLAAATTLTTGGAEQLANTAVVDSQGAINLVGDETIASLAGAGTVAMGDNSLTLANATGTSSAAVISGTGGLTLTAGTQTLTGVSTYTGTTVVNGGTLNINGANASASLDVNAGTLVLNATSAALDADISAGAVLTTGAADRLANNVIITNNGTVNLGGNETLGALSGSGNVNLGAFNLTFAGDGDDVSGELTSNFAGSISSTGTITKTGNDIQVLSGVSAYSGIAFVNDGILRVTNAGALGATNSNGRTEVSGTGTLEISGGITLAEVIRPTAVGYAATFTGNDAYLTNLGAINNLDGTNTLTGQIGIVGGVPDVVIGASGGTLNLTGDIIRFTGPGSPVPQLTFQAAESATIVLTGSNAVFQLANIVDINKTGGGTLDITNIIGNNSTGDLLLHDGTVKVKAETNLGGSVVRFGDTDRGSLRIVSTAAQSAVVSGVGEVLTGGDGTFADFRATVFDFTNGDGALFTEADTSVTLSNLQNFAGQNVIKNGTADLLIDTRGGALAKDLPTLVINSGNVFFLAEDTASLSLGGIDGLGGSLSFGSLDVVINQVTSGNYGGAIDGTGNLTLNATGSASLFTSGVISNFASVTIGGDGTGSVTLAGDSTYTGATNVVSGGDLTITGTLASLTLDIATGGSATLSASDRLTDATAVINAGSLDLGANTDTVGSYTSNGGTLSGTGTLTAATYALNDGTTVDANLGNGDITANGTVAINGNTGTGSINVQTGTTTLAGASFASTVQIDTAGSLVTTATGTLDDATAVTIDGAGQLTLGQDETIGSLAGTGGAIHLGATTLTLSDGAGASSAAAIDGTGGLTLTTGTQTLSGASTYTGATNVNGGTLDLTGSLVSTTVNVANGAALNSTGGLADDTDLVLTGTGAATFTGAETLATLGGAGTLDVTDLTVGTLNGTSTINSSGLVTASDGSFGGNLATGGLTKTSVGTLTLTGSSATTGPITVDAGTLALANGTDTLADTAALVANAGTTVDVGANTDTIGSFTSNGANLTGTGTLTAGTYTLNDGTIIDANLGNGTTTVSGLVRLNASTGTGSFTVLNGGELRGVGADIGGDLTVDLGGTVAPGASPGVTNVAGNWTQNGTFAAEVAGLGGAGAVNGHDQITVGGTITLGPASTLAIQRFGAFTEPALGDTFQIIVGDLTGQQFANVTTQFSTGLVFDLADGTLIGTGLAGTAPSGKVDLTTLPGLDANSVAMIAALQVDAFAGDANGVQINSSSGAAVPSGQAVRALLTSPIGSTSNFNKLSPEPFAGDSAYAIMASRNYVDTALGTAPVARVGNFTLFTAFSAHNAGTDSSVNAADYDLTGSGGLLGGRIRVGERSSVGVFGAFDSGEVKSTHRTGDVTGQVFGVFAQTSLGEAWTLTAAASLGNYDVDSSRASLTAPRATASGVGTTSTGVSLGLAYEMVKTKTGGFSPYVEFDYVTAETDAFTEIGSVDALSVSSIDHTSIIGELGGRGYVMVSERFSLQGHLAVAQDFGDDDTPVTARLASGGTSFTVVSPGFGSTAFKAGVGADYAITDNFTLSAGVEAAISADATTGTAFRIGGGLSF